MLRATIAAAIAVAGVAGAHTAEAGDVETTASITVRYEFDEGREASAESLTQAEADATDPLLFLRAEPAPLDISNGGMCIEEATARENSGTDGRFEKDLVCGDVDATGSVYDFGIDAVPSRFFVGRVNCFENRNSVFLSDTEPTLTPAPGEDWECYVSIEPKPLVFIDKVVDFDAVCDDFEDEATCLSELGLSWDSTDFPLEIYDADGEQVMFESPVLDPDRDECEPDVEFGGDFFGPGTAATASLLPVDDSLCVAVPLAPGEYTMGEVLPSHGYEAAHLYCVSVSPGGNEMLPAEDFSFVVSDRWSETTFCVLVNEYLVQTLVADLVIDGGDLGPAAPADFVISVTRDGDDAVVATGFDPEPGVDNASAEFELPVGAYSLGVSAPDGYTATVELSADAVGRLQAPAADADSVGHEFMLSRSVAASAVITVTYAVATTTTTTTTTPATTVPATTAAPVTTAAPAVTTTVGPTTTLTVALPATGSDGGQTTNLLLLAIGLLALGGGIVTVSRRH
ncbi:hypothetical protein [Ilumatobacter coccineus]|nr:hypothetical protein [Ilumatobacter coccineus]